MQQPLPIVISACLLGERVRYDGAHKLQPWTTDPLFAEVEWVPVCPEVGMGLSVPRPTLHLEAAPGGLRLLETASGTDLTPAMKCWLRRELLRLADLRLAAAVLKSGSPSCGTGGLPVLRGGEVVQTGASGLFAAALRQRFPGLPIADEVQLGDREARSAFVAAARRHRSRCERGDVSSR